MTRRRTTSHGALETPNLSGLVHRLVTAALSMSLAALPLPASAWGSEGHRLVATLAEHQLSERARTEVDPLLALEPGATLASISTWATPSTAAWHYVNLPRDSGCRYDAARDCPDGQCVVAAIERQHKVLMSTAPDVDRLKALKYVVHFVADVHQPLHAGFADDKGGNTYQVQAFGRGTNLHALWDTKLIENWRGGEMTLLSELESKKAAEDDAVAPPLWAEESCRIVASPDFYPVRRRVGDDYIALWGPTLEGRLSAAGRRLARLLNESFSFAK